MPDILLLVPAFQPGAALVDLVSQVRVAAPGTHVLVIDDGSGAEYRSVFEAAAALGARVHHLAVNRGKGHALKVGFALASGGDRPVVTADADGQHAVADILRVAAAIDTAPTAPDHLVLGVREFDAAVPVRSRIGNDATRLLFRLATGQRVDDTQTGLRGFPAALLPWLADIPGERHEYELTVLLTAARHGVELRPVTIETIYLDGNATSHFRPIADSTRIYLPLLAFLGSSVAAFAVDTVALLLLSVCGLPLLTAVVGAHALSATTNFAANRRLVFTSRDQLPLHLAGRRYAALATALLVGNYLLLTAFTALGLPLLAAKLLTEPTLFLLSFGVQSPAVFRSRTARTRPGGHVVGSGVEGTADRRAASEEWAARCRPVASSGRPARRSP